MINSNDQVPTATVIIAPNTDDSDGSEPRSSARRLPPKFSSLPRLERADNSVAWFNAQ